MQKWLIAKFNSMLSYSHKSQSGRSFWWLSTTATLDWLFWNKSPTLGFQNWLGLKSSTTTFSPSQASLASICPNWNPSIYVHAANEANNSIASIRELRKCVWPLTELSLEGNAIVEMRPLVEASFEEEMDTFAMESIKSLQTMNDYQFTAKITGKPTNIRKTLRI